MSSNIGDFDGGDPPIKSIFGVGGTRKDIGVIRNVTPQQDRVHFNCPKMYQVFMAVDGNYNAVSGELPKDQADEALRMMTTHPEMSKQMLFVVEVSRRAIEANFSPMLIRPQSNTVV